MYNAVGVIEVGSTTIEVLDLNKVADQIVELAKDKYANRIRDIVDTIEQYAEKGKPIDPELVKELKALLRL